MFRIKPDVNIMDKLRRAGFSTYRIAHERLFGQSTLTKFRRGGLPSWGELDRLCFLLRCGPWDIVEYIADAKQEGKQPAQDKTDRPTD